MKVLLADDHALFRQGVLLALQELYPDVQVAEAGSVAEAMRLIAEDDYDIVLFDLVMPDADGLESLRQVVRAAGDTPVVVISASEEVEDIRGSIDAGARGYILKSSSIEALRHGLPLVLCGETYIPLPGAALANIERSGEARGNRGQIAPGTASRHQFTPRQLEVAKLLLQGHSNKEIGRHLGLLEGTVKVHVREIMRKLGVQNRTQAALVAAQLRLFDDNDR